MRAKKNENYIDNKGNYVNVENLSLKDIYLRGYCDGRRDKALTELGDDLRKKE